ncbi:MAG: carboxynorspermidine decarboxylase [Bacteroidaceae bacterium]|nr:carboxynorspermidine decarboxylase [Bacteroidaceae bacterium]
MTPNPCYIIEEDLLRRNLSLIKDVATRANVEIILAFKAFALWKTFPIFREYIDHTTASSPYEARLAFEEFGSYAHSYSPAYTEENFPEFMRCSSHITFNSFSQFERFYPETLKADHKISCGIRVNPEYSEIETDLYNPCAPGSRFGVTVKDLPPAPSFQDGEKCDLPDGIRGFHCHCHCEDDSYTLERTLKNLEEKFGKWFPQLEWLNLGGGHLMTRKDYDVEHLIRVLNGLHERYPNLRIILEPGSAFAWQTGPLVSKVVDIVENHGIKTAILNVSFACHMPDCLEMPYQPAVRNATPSNSPTGGGQNLAEGGQKNPDGINPPLVGESEGVYRLGGNSCLSGDFIGSWLFDHELQIGEEIIFEDMIHYTTVKTHMFNGISHPAIAMKHSDGTIEVLREFAYEDYKNRMD